MPALASRLAVLARRSVREFQDDNCTQYAAAISFHVLFSLFPLAILLVSVLGIVLRDASAREHVLNSLLGVVPLSDQGRADLDTLLRSVTGSLTALGFLSLLGLIWSASGMMGAIRAALNAAWDLDAGRKFVRGKLVDVGLLASTGLLVGLSLGLTIAVRVASNVSRSAAAALGPLSAGAGAVGWLLGVLAPLAVTFVTFAFLYTVVPATRVRLADAWPGALVAALGFELAKNGFAVYLARFGHYNAVYGSLGAVIAFLFFVYIASMVFLLGAEVASEVPRLRAPAE